MIRRRSSLRRNAMLNRRHALAGFCALCAGLAASGAPPARAADPVAKTTLTPDEALARLLEGNRRFVADDPLRPDIGNHRRHELAVGQAPFAAILGCADSRVAPETLFGAGLGEIFTTRVAGNTLAPAILGSLEYSVAVLGAPLILVLGHERCGAVVAAVEVAERATVLPGSLTPMIEPILPAVAAVRGRPGDLVDNAVKEHARRTAARLRTGEPSLAGAIRDGKLKVAAGYYDLDDGKVDILEV
jgi:carbonic anhydrase